VNIASTRVRVTLEEAVFDWLNYLDVAVRVETRDEGKFGHALAVYLTGGVSHDLTHVGVGVSQVLPIVVMCLLGNRETTLILEQPELHLNPKVQTRLGDFFLSMALLGKQCLIETHSEYLINRLRFRAAAAPTDSLSKLMTLYFVEKHEGVTAYRNVVINEFGAIVDWPAGFFDQSQREVEDILLAATRKAKSGVPD
jgi:predicted ATPase